MLTLTAILSDIHGNLPALESVLEDMAQYDIDRVISLGDVSGYYPFINEVIELLRSHQAVNLIGNHDRYIIDNTECPRSTSANLCLTYQKSVITDNNREWLAKSSSSPLIFEEASMVHGGWDDPEDEYLYKINTSYFERFDEKFFFCGHTHVQKYINLNNGQFFTNPGSVGQPRDGISDAAYCIFDEKNRSVELKRVPYDIDIVADKMKALGFDEKFYTNLYTGSRIGGKVDTIEVKAKI
jgi:predicted phosphodiesterase